MKNTEHISLYINIFERYTRPMTFFFVLNDGSLDGFNGS